VDYNHKRRLALGSSGTSASQYCPPGEASCIAPVAEWNFEEGSGNNAYDTSGKWINRHFKLQQHIPAENSEKPYISTELQVE